MEYTTNQAAKLLGVTPGRIRQYVTEGRIKPRYLTPRMMVIDARQIAKLNNRRTVPGPAPRKTKHGQRNK